MKFHRVLLAAALGALALSALPIVRTAEEDVKATDAQVIEAQLPSYPLETCLVSGLPLDKKGAPVDVVREGRLARFCCKGCIGRFEEDSAKYFAAIDEAVIADQGPRYPTKTCIVSGEPIEDVVDVVHGTRLIRMCCKMCKREFANDPVAYMAELDKQWIAAQLPDYPLTTCAVSGEELGSMGEPLNVLYGTHLVRLCCKGCKRALAKDPKAVLATIAEARAAKPAEKAPEKKGE